MRQQVVLVVLTILVNDLISILLPLHDCDLLRAGFMHQALDWPYK